MRTRVRMLQYLEPLGIMTLCQRAKLIQIS